MPRPHPLLLALALALATTAPTPAQAQVPPDSTIPANANAATRALHALFAADWERQLRESPLFATYLGDPRYNDRWPDLSPAALDAQEQAVRDSRATLAKIDRTALSPADQLNYDIYAAILDDSIAAQRFPTERIPVAQDGGPHMIAVSMLQVMRFNAEKDYRDW